MGDLVLSLGWSRQNIDDRRVSRYYRWDWLAQAFPTRWNKVGYRRNEPVAPPGSPVTTPGLRKRPCFALSQQGDQLRNSVYLKIFPRWEWLEGSMGLHLIPESDR